MHRGEHVGQGGIGDVVMDYAIYDPEITTTTVIDPYDDPSGLTYVSNSSMVHWRGRFWAIMDGTTQGFVEGATGQQIWLTTSVDGATWEPAYRPFRDAAHCNNPLTAENLDWQPNLVVVEDELWCTWCSADTYLSKLTDPDGKWTSYRFEFDGTAVRLSATITGSAGAEWSTRATINGHGALFGFPTQNPLVLSSGAVVCPLVFESFTEFSTQTTAASTFIRGLKWAALLKFDGAWSTMVVDTSPFGDFPAWEPFVVENRAGHIFVFVRSLNTLAADDDMLLVSACYDGDSFVPAWSTKMLVPSTRGFVGKVSPRRWLMVHCDHPQNSTRQPNQTFSSNVRRNGSLFFSKLGWDDFVPGINFSGDDGSMNYPQFTTHDGRVFINYTSGTGVGVRRSLKLVTVDPIPDDGLAYVHPRSVNAFTAIGDPTLVEEAPPYFRFNGANRAVSASPLSASGGVTYAAWLRWDSESDIIVDTRNAQGTAGHAFLIRGLAIRRLNFLHGRTLPPGVPVFTAAVVDNSAMAVTLYVGDGELHTVTGHYRSLVMAGLPSDGDTVTVDGAVFTFRTTAVLSSEVQIGASVSATVTNLAAKLSMYKDTPGGGRLTLARFDLAAFSVSSGSPQISVASSIPLDGGVAVVGRSANPSSLSTLSGRIYDARVYDSALTAANITYLHDVLAEDLGHAPLGGGADPGAAVLHCNPSDPDVEAFPPSGIQVGYCETLDGVLRIHGEGSAGVEMPYPVTRLTLRFKLGATPAGADKYVVATFGSAQSPVRLHVSGDHPTKLYANSREVGTVSPTVYTTVAVDVYTDKIRIGGFEHYFSGSPRCFLGNAFPENLLAASKSVDHDVAAMAAVRIRE